MGDLSVAELSRLLKVMSGAIASLLALLLVVQGLVRLLIGLARRQSLAGDLDLIGHEATVIRSIRPHRNGRITCQSQNRTVTFNASANQAVKVGETVLITAFDRGTARTVPRSELAADPVAPDGPPAVSLPQIDPPQPPADSK
jgi:hypothetical protein